MVKRNKEIEDHLEDIKFLLAGILLKRTPNIKQVAKIIGCSDKKLTSLFPQKQKKSTENGKK